MLLPRKKLWIRCRRGRVIKAASTVGRRISREERNKDEIKVATECIICARVYGAKTYIYIYREREETTRLTEIEAKGARAETGGN